MLLIYSSNYRFCIISVQDFVKMELQEIQDRGWWACCGTTTLGAQPLPEIYFMAVLNLSVGFVGLVCCGFEADPIEVGAVGGESDGDDGGSTVENGSLVQFQRCGGEMVTFTKLDMVHDNKGPYRRTLHLNHKIVIN